MVMGMHAVVGCGAKFAQALDFRQVCTSGTSKHALDMWNNASCKHAMPRLPALLGAGDEVAKTHNGNNNWYGHDNKLAHLNWNGNEDAQVGIEG